jgi:hypothetical protein
MGDAPPGGEHWEWIDVPGMVCGDGSETGIALNFTTRSKKLMLFFMGGGACWEAGGCFAINGAQHLDGYTAATFEGDRPILDGNWSMQRDDPASPFGDATWVFVPYCTGDLHSGTRVATYDVLGTPRTVAHEGGANVDAMLALVKLLSPSEVFAVGVSAGGFGVQLNADRIAAAFPGVPTHILADSAQPVAWEWQRYGTMQQAWGMRFPTGCTTCPQSLANLSAAVQPPGRYGVIGGLRDQVLELYLGLDDGALSSETRAVAATLSGAKAMFVADVATHVQLGSPDEMTSSGISVRQFVTAWATGGGAFATTGP